jgi:hypothetical protein
MNEPTLMTCIYCPNTFDPTKGEGDHVISVQLGQFKGDERFRRVCSKCNTQIGRSEQQFLRCSPIATYREIVDPVVPNRRNRKISASTTKGAHGSPPPQKFARLGELEIEVRSMNGNPDYIEPIEQIIIDPSSENPQVIPLFPGMRVEQFAKKIAKLDIDIGKCEVYLSCDEAHSEEYYKLIRSQFSSANFDSMETIEPFEKQGSGRVKYVFGDHYFRVIVKIAFHHYLLHSRRGYIGDEEIFEPVRNFIVNGGDYRKFIDCVPPPVDLPFGPMPDGRLFTTKLWNHFVLVKEVGPDIVVAVQLFMGPKAYREAHTVLLAKDCSRIQIPNGMWGHRFVYDEVQQGNWAGFVERFPISRIPRNITLPRRMI